MTITSQTTQRGKVIHLVSSSDLVDAVQSGERLRASCPIHGSDHQRSLSIDSALAGASATVAMPPCWYNQMLLSSPAVKETGMGNVVLTAVGLVMEQAQHICLCPLCAHTCYDGCVLRHLFHTGNKRKWLLS